MNVPLQEANELIRKITLPCLEIDIILLDQWRRSRKKNEWRLTYLGQKIGSCSNNCSICPVYNIAGGEDNSTDDQRLITTLILATEKDLQNYAGSQRYLNCKSLDQYIVSFVRCFQEECHSREEMLDELDYVVGFKIIYHRDNKDLKLIEQRIKQEIIQKSLASLDKPRRELFLDAAKDKGLVE